MDKKKNIVEQEDYTKIGKAATLKGDLQSEGDLRVDGIIEGNIVSNGRLVIGETAKIKGNLRCKNAEVYGTLSGDIHCDNLLILKSTANVEGSIKVKQFALEQGAILNTSSIDMRGDNHKISNHTPVSEN